MDPDFTQELTTVCFIQIGSASASRGNISLKAPRVTLDMQLH